MIYAYWAVVAAIVIMNIAGTITVSWWLIAALVALPVTVAVVIFMVGGALVLWADTR